MNVGVQGTDLAKLSRNSLPVTDTSFIIIVSQGRALEKREGFVHINSVCKFDFYSVSEVCSQICNLEFGGGCSYRLKLLRK